MTTEPNILIEGPSGFPLVQDVMARCRVHAFRVEREFDGKPDALGADCYLNCKHVLTVVLERDPDRPERWDGEVTETALDDVTFWQDGMAFYGADALARIGDRLPALMHELRALHGQYAVEMLQGY